MTRLFSIIFLSFILFACSNRKDVSDQLPILKSHITADLKQIVDSFTQENHSFIYNVFRNDTSEVQVINSNFIKKGPFALTISLSFDESIPGEKEKHERFKNTDYYSEFTFYEWMEIPCYVLDCQSDYEKTANTLTNLLITVYQFSETTIFTTDTYDGGSLENL